MVFIKLTNLELADLSDREFYINSNYIISMATSIYVNIGPKLHNINLHDSYTAISISYGNDSETYCVVESVTEILRQIEGYKDIKDFELSGHL